MSDPTKNTPWKVKHLKPKKCFIVVDSTDNEVHNLRFYYDTPLMGVEPLTKEGAEALARMVAAGSVAGELYATMKRLACLGNGDQPGNSVGNVIAQQAIAKAAPLLEPAKDGT